jgi:hypothetical protein
VRQKRISTAKFTARRQNSSPIAKRVVQFMTLHTRQCEYGLYCPGRKPGLTGLACKHTRDLGQGYYFSEPIEADLALQQLRTQHPFQTPQAKSATEEIRPLEEDDSPTIMMPGDSIGYPPEAKEEEEDEPQ